MKNLRFSFFFSVFCLLISSRNQITAQSNTWVQNNAVWHYDWDNFSGTSGFLKTRYIGDTILNGQLSKILATTSYSFFLDQNNISHLSSIAELDTNYTWNNQNQIYYWRENEFELLYDFTKVAGESYLIDSNEDITFFCNPSSTANVINSGTITYANQNYATLDLDYNDGDHTRFQGSVNARFGNYSSFSTLSWLFPINAIGCDPGIVVEYPYYKFRCFQDDSLMVNPTNEECEYQLTHVGITELNENGYLLYPNPAANFVTLVSPFEQNNVQIFTISGSLIYSGQSITKIQEMSLNLPKGTYILKVSSDDHLRYTEKLVIQ